MLYSFTSLFAFTWAQPLSIGGACIYRQCEMLVKCCFTWGADLLHYYMYMYVLLFLLHAPVLTGWETANKYRIRNTLGQQVYFAAERKLLLVHVTITLIMLLL